MKNIGVCGIGDNTPRGCGRPFTKKALFLFNTDLLEIVKIRGLYLGSYEKQKMNKGKKKIVGYCKHCKGWLYLGEVTDKSIAVVMEL